MESNILRESAILWLESNTTIDVKTTPLPSNVELFIEKYGSIMELRPGVSSESISGLSQSFNSSDISMLLRQYAKEILGEENMVSDVKVFPALEKWVY